MRIAIIGSGNVGSALGHGWAKRGHDVVFGVRDPNKTAATTNTRTAPVKDAAQSGDVVVLAVPWAAVPDALRSAGDLKGKVLLDCTNPLLPDLSGLDVPAGTSGGEIVAGLAPGALVVKIFNTTGAANMTNPDFHGQPATMFYCGDDGGAKGIASGLAGDLGFEPVDAGPLSQSRQLESLCLLWVSLAIKQGLGVNFAFKVLRR
jgi:8-hydroxy-5-deazaflavin:NADPH oxidoreductase